MILGIGTDIIEISRVQQSLENFEDKFISKYFTDKEIAYASSKPSQRAISFASAWAVKEAVSKALGTGIRDDITLSSIGLVRNENGKPDVILTGGTKILAKSLSETGKYRIFISISHDNGMALAFAVLEQR